MLVGHDTGHCSTAATTAGQQHDGPHCYAGLPPTTTPIDGAGSFLESWDVIEQAKHLHRSAKTSVWIQDFYI